MPVKDIAGPPLPTVKGRELIIEIHRRLGLLLPKRPRFRDDGGLEPEPIPSGPNPTPLAGGTAAVFE